MNASTELIDLMQRELQNSIEVKQKLFRNEGGVLDRLGLLADSCISSLRAGGKIIFAGNGGSFADAQHLSAEFVSRFLVDRRPLASIVLGANASAMSAIGNDYGFESVFARELEALARPEDVFIPISTSGNSPNILAAVRRAHKMGVSVVGFTGAGGRLSTECNCICVPSSLTARSQECHITLGHILCGTVEAALVAKAT